MLAERLVKIEDTTLAAMLQQHHSLDAHSLGRVANVRNNGEEAQTLRLGGPSTKKLSAVASFRELPD